MAEDSDGRKFPEYLEYTKSTNGREKTEERQKREWLIYSESARAIYCVPCMLFSCDGLKKPSASALNTKEGYKISDLKWRRMYNKFPDHEVCKAHKTCYLKWKNLRYSLMEAKGIDSQLQQEIQLDVDRNKAILERILDVTLFLALRNLPFRGSTETLGDVRTGHFLGTVELVAKYDPLLNDHPRKVKEKRPSTRVTHYLSQESQNEFIELCGDRVLKEILKERECAIYYLLICDATPDVSHKEQNVILLRYVAQKENDQCDVTERFLQFEEFSGKTGHEISEMILKTLEEHHIDIADCRGQGFDNGSAMSGKVKGVQAEIRTINPLAAYSPCGSHTLNLVGVHAAESCTDVSTFFGCLNRLYNIFSASPER